MLKYLRVPVYIYFFKQLFFQIRPASSVGHKPKSSFPLHLSSKIVNNKKYLTNRKDSPKAITLLHGKSKDNSSVYLQTCEPEPSPQPENTHP